MSKIQSLQADIDAGKVVIPVWSECKTCVYRDDKGKYVLVTRSGICTSDSLDEIYKELSVPIDAGQDEDNYSDFQCALQARGQLVLPTWQVADTSLPERHVTGKTIFDLRAELEDGKVVSPVLHIAFQDGLPYCIRKESNGYNQYTPSPWNDINRTYDSVDDIVAYNFLAHFPIWIVGESPEFARLEKEYYQEQEAEAEAEAALDAAPSRTIEVSEREYRAIIETRAEVEKRANQPQNDDPFEFERPF